MPFLASSASQGLSSPCTSLQPISPSQTAAAAAAADSSPAASATSTDALAHERQTLLLMLLAQVCSLHDATPRTFVVHVIALYERGILDFNSIRFLFDLGLVPRGYDLDQIGDGDGIVSGRESGNDGGDHASNENGNNFSEGHLGNGSRSIVGGTQSVKQGAIVPYCAEPKQRSRTRHLPPPPLTSFKRSNLHSKDENSSNSSSFSKKMMAHRQKEALAIRKCLEKHESIDSSANASSILGSSNAAIPANTSSAASTSNNRWDRANSTTTQSTLTSAEESFVNPPYQPQHTMRDVYSNQLSAYAPEKASWSVEHHPLSFSRYQREFSQQSLLATGAFGSVYHAVHRLEQRPYAVKCVTFSASGYYAEALSNILREVRCLAQLDHPNCVRYYTSWLEPSWMTGDRDDGRVNDFDYDDEHAYDDDADAYEARRHIGEKGSRKLLSGIERVIEGVYNTEEMDNSIEQLEAVLYGRTDQGKMMDDGFDWVSSQKSRRPSSAFSSDRGDRKDATDDDEWGNLPDPDSRSASGDNRGNGSDDASGWTQDINTNSRMNDHGESRGHHNSRHVVERRGSLELVPQRGGGGVNSIRRLSHHRAATYKYRISLYIQMQLCKTSTLSDWIKRRNHSHTNFGAEEQQVGARPALEIFRQIVNGLAHVHAKGIIHRDLKPENIFVGNDGSFMIGDFGLSKMMRDATNDPLANNVIVLPRDYNNVGHTAGVGTASYASPEQIKTKMYGTAADIFSLGLILLELFNNFTSEHERARAFHNCRHKRKLAPWMELHYPEVSALILACTQADWSRRPSASDIQAAALFRERGNSVEIFQAELRALGIEMTRKDRLIQNQRDEMKEKDEIIAKLKRHLAEVESSSGATAEIGIEDSSNSCISSDDDY